MFALVFDSIVDVLKLLFPVARPQECKQIHESVGITNFVSATKAIELVSLDAQMLWVLRFFFGN